METKVTNKGYFTITLSKEIFNNWDYPGNKKGVVNLLEVEAGQNIIKLLNEWIEDKKAKDPNYITNLKEDDTLSIQIEYKIKL